MNFKADFNGARVFRVTVDKGERYSMVNNMMKVNMKRIGQQSSKPVKIIKLKKIMQTLINNLGAVLDHRPGEWWPGGPYMSQYKTSKRLKISHQELSH